MLKEKTISAVLWSGVDIFFRQAFQFIVTIALARMLSPEEFGTIALLYIFTSVASMLVSSGFSAALIQSQKVTYTDECTVFWFNFTMAVICAIGLWQISPWVSEFYGKPELIPLMWVLALNLIISSLSSIHSTLLVKRLSFKGQTKVGVISAVVSGLIAVGLAWLDFGVWALAWQSLAAALITTALLWKINKWRPALVFSLSSFRRLFRFGSFMLMCGLLDVIYNRIYTVLIGKQYGSWELGIYDRAYGTQQLPAGTLTSILSRVAFPVFSMVADNKQQLISGVRQAVKGIMFINIPLMLGVMVTAKSLIPVLFGGQWGASVPLLQILCLAGVLYPLHAINVNVLTAQGHSHLLLRVEVVKKTIGVAIILIASNYGASGIAWSVALLSVLGLFINAHYTKVYLGYGVYHQIKDCLPQFTVASVMAVILYGIGSVLTWSSPWLLLTQVFMGALIYFVGCMFFCVKAFQDMRLLLTEQLSRKAKC